MEGIEEDAEEDGLMECENMMKEKLEGREIMGFKEKKKKMKKRKK